MFSRADMENKERYINLIKTADRSEAVYHAAKWITKLKI